MFACVYNDKGEYGYHDAATMEWAVDDVIKIFPTRKYVNLDVMSSLTFEFMWL
jgi:hypothetical protein